MGPQGIVIDRRLTQRDVIVMRADGDVLSQARIRPRHDRGHVAPGFGVLEADTAGHLAGHPLSTSAPPQHGLGRRA
jgi:hypothetical protein